MTCEWTFYGVDFNHLFLRMGKWFFFIFNFFKSIKYMSFLNFILFKKLSFIFIELGIVGKHGRKNIGEYWKGPNI
jgi:hypothetical protein